MTITILNNTSEQGMKINKYDSNRYLSLTNYGTANIVKFYDSPYKTLDVEITPEGTAPIPNQLLSGEHCGDILFTINLNSTILYTGSIIILDVNKPEDYTLIETELLNTYNSEFIDLILQGNKYGIAIPSNIKKLNLSGIKGYLSTVYGTSDNPITFNESIGFFTNLEEIITDENTRILFGGKTEPAYVSFSRAFFCCEKLKSIDLSFFKFFQPISTRLMFYGCKSLTSINLDNFDTSSVTSMELMFSNCKSLTSINLDNFDTSSVTSMKSMFSNCNSLTSVNLSNFNTSSVTSMEFMFSNCNSLTSLNLDNFDTSKVTSFYSMFGNCCSLTSLKLNGFNSSVSNVCTFMFYNCQALSSLDLSNMDTSLCTSMESMFAGCTSLNSLTLSSNWGSNTSIDLFDLSDCPLTHDSCLDVFNKLADKTQTVTTSAELKLNLEIRPLMSDSEIAIATAKGWDINFC